MESTKIKGKKEVLSNVSSGGNGAIGMQVPFMVEIDIKGSCPILFHRWNCESVKEKSEAKKGSKIRKTDDIESYIYRDENKNICLPTEYVRQSIIYAAKSVQDPRSPRKSGFDLFKAAIVGLEELNLINGGVKEWDYLDQRRVVVMRSGITRSRPAFKQGWTAKVVLQVLIPEYIDEYLLQEVVTMAGRFVGLGDMRPTYGRFNIVKFKVKR